MKQGRAQSSKMASTKVEPMSQGINPGYAGSIGIQEVRTKPVQVYEGRGLEAPKVKSTIHNSGSQGKH